MKRSLLIISILMGLTGQIFANSGSIHGQSFIREGTYLPYEETTNKETDPGPEKLVNGDFETFEVPYLPVDSYKPEMITFPVQTTDAHTGTYAVKFTGTDTYDQGINVLPYAVPVIPSSNYICKSWSKGTGETGLWLAYVGQWREGWSFNWSGDHAGTWQPISPQLLLNNTVEDWTGGVPDDWTVESTGGSPTITQETSIVHSGSSAVKLTNDSSGNSIILSQSFTGLSQEDYKFKFYAQGVSGAYVQPKIFYTNGDSSKVYNNQTNTWDDYSWPLTSQQYHRIDDLSTEDYQFAEDDRIRPYTDGTLKIGIFNESNPNGVLYLDDFYFGLDSGFNPSDENSVQIIPPTTVYTQFISDSVPAPTNALLGYLYVSWISSSSNFYLDDIYFGVNGTGANLIDDPSFDYWDYAHKTETPTGWTDLSNDDGEDENAPSLIPSRTTDAHSGTYAVKFNGLSTFENGFSALSAPVAMTSSTRYGASIWAKDVLSGTLYYAYEYVDIWGKSFMYNFTGPYEGQWIRESPQLTTDAGIETWSDSTTPTYWPVTISGGGGSVTREGTIKHSGNYSAKLTSGSSGELAFIKQTISDLDPDNRYDLQFFARSALSTGSTSVMIFNSAGDHVYNFSSRTYDSYAGGPPSEGQIYTWSITSTWASQDQSFAPYSDGTAVIAIFSDGTSSAISYIDDIDVSADSGGGPDEYTLIPITVTDTYIHYSLDNFPSPVGVDEISIIFATTSSSLKIDDAYCGIDGTGTNLISNPSFADWTFEDLDPYPTGWLTNDSGDAYYEKSTTEHYSGLNSIKFVNTSGGSDRETIGQLITGTPGDYYTTTIYAKGAVGGEHSNIALYNDNIEGGATPTQTWSFTATSWQSVYPGTYADNIKETNLTTSWQAINVTFIIPASGKVYLAYSNKSGEASTMYYDAATCYQPGDLRSIKIYDMTNPSRLEDLTENDNIFSLHFDGDDKYAFGLDGSGKWHTDFEDGFGFHSDLYLDAHGEATSGEPEQDSYDLSFYANVYHDGTATTHKWTLNAEADAEHGGSYFKLELNGNTIANWDSSGNNYINGTLVDKVVETDQPTFYVDNHTATVSVTLYQEVTIILPSDVQIGHIVTVSDTMADCPTYPITVVPPEGETITSTTTGNDSYIINSVTGQVVQFKKLSSTIWKVM